MDEDLKQDGQGVTIPEEVMAAYQLVDQWVSKASGVIHGGPVWHGWALREAYLAGVKAERERILSFLNHRADSCVGRYGAAMAEGLRRAVEAIRSGHSVTETKRD